MRVHRQGVLALLAFVTLVALPLVGLSPVTPVHAAGPTSVTIAGDLDPQLGCSGQWQADCASAHLTYDSNSDVWLNGWSLAAGSYQYKAALNDSWTVSYGQNTGGNNIPLNVASTRTVNFFYDDKTHWITDDVNSVIATVAGDFQQAMGCSSNWAPGCMRSWLEDPNGTGTYSFTTTALPHGSYQAKVTINRSWTENYGAGGAPGGANINFTVPQDNVKVTFTYNPTSYLLSISSGHSHDNTIDYSGLGHNSQDTLYRSPFGAISLGTALTLRFRTYHNDVTGVRVRFYDAATSKEFFQDMSIAASGVPCQDPSTTADSCDFWQTTYTPTALTTLYYRFIVTDGTATAYYADTSFQDGSWGQATGNLVDNSYAVTVYDPSFQPISWLSNAVIYQIFPDRFRNGDGSNDPNPVTEPRYGYPNGSTAATDQIISKVWSTDLPEGFCHTYSNPIPACTEQPEGRDYYGGDLKGVDDKLPYLKSLGVNTIYFNPIFESASNHGYDTRDYLAINHFLGSLADWQKLSDDAHAMGMKIILDGVFNHVSSDSPYFDRYHHFSSDGACEDVNSPYRSWFTFHDVPAGTGVCAGSAGPNSATYDAWDGFDSLPVLNKNVQAVRDMVYAGSNAVATYWLKNGADGWRLDVMSDGSFPVDYWQQFRSAVKAVNPNAPIIGELWKKSEVLPKVQGDQADTAMDYRFRNAVLGYLGTVDNKGFPDDGQSDEPPSLFAQKLLSIREDNPDASYYGMMNLLDSHDTQRILWTLTPGNNNRQDREFNSANVITGTALERLAATIQMTVPGAPTIYYGDEVNLTGADDPDDRRPFPWTDGGVAGPQTASAPYYGAAGNHATFDYYQQLTTLRSANTVFRQGKLSFLLTDDTQGTMAYLLRTSSAAAVVAINRNATAQTLTIPVSGQLPQNVQLTDGLGGIADVTAANGTLTVNLPAYGAAVLLPTSGQSLTLPTAPTGLTAQAGNGQVTLNWDTVVGAAGYNVYRSPVTGGGYTLLGPASGTSYIDSSVTNGTHYFYVVRATDAGAEESASSNEAGATPAFPIGYAVLQYPTSIVETIQVTPTQTIYGRVYVHGLTDASGDPNGIMAQVGFGPQGSDPSTWTTWTAMSYNSGHSGDSNYEYLGQLRPEQTGVYDMLVRFSSDGGLTWAYGDVDGYVPGSNSGTNDPGTLTVTTDPNAVQPNAPTNLRVNDWSSNFIALGWDAVPNAAEYWLYRATSSGGYGSQPLAKISTPTTVYTDTTVSNNTTYYYVVKALSSSLTPSVASNEISQTAQLKLVNVTFRVHVPAETPPSDTVYLVGSIDALGPWNPSLWPMTNKGNGIWETSLQILDGTALQYKFTRGSWNQVEWWGSITSTANRNISISYGNNGTQLVDDTAQDWGSSGNSDDNRAVQYWRDPLVTSTVPMSGALLTAAPNSVNVTFARDIQPSSSDFSKSVVVMQGSSTISGTVAANGSNGLTWTPAAPLSAGSYTVTVFNLNSSVGGDSVPMAEPYAFSFTVPTGGGGLPTPELDSADLLVSGLVVAGLLLALRRRHRR